MRSALAATQFEDMELHPPILARGERGECGALASREYGKASCEGSRSRGVAIPGDGGRKIA